MAITLAAPLRGFILNRVSSQRLLRNSKRQLRRKLNSAPRDSLESNQHEMNLRTILPDLIPELFDSILSYITSPKSLSHLSLTCKELYSKTHPKLYSTWKHNGQIHSLTSLQYFPRIILTNPSIASQVQVLGLQGWGVDALFTLWDKSVEEDTRRWKEVAREIDLVEGWEETYIESIY
ncbi:hypothetical protein DL95DRAFT_418044 [Leptodontidium sp. 2 PMI_412]|nr:hypothetical protein DL95DRAFT_418044 [Leptodontidium sp. 2 PMI_412]